MINEKRYLLLSPEELKIYKKSKLLSPDKVREEMRKYEVNYNRDVVMVSDRTEAKDYDVPDCDGMGLKHVVVGRLLRGESLTDFIQHMHLMQPVIEYRAREGSLKKKVEAQIKYNRKKLKVKSDL